MKFVALPVSLLLSFVLAAVARGQTSPRCSSGPEAAAKLLALPPMWDLSRSWEERLAPRRALAAAEPADGALQFTLQGPLLRAFHLSPEWDAAIARYRGLPDRALGLTLEARLLASLHRRRSRQLLDEALRLAPASPWVHLTLLEWFAHPVNRDTEAAARHFEEWRKLCPDGTQGFAFLDVVGDADRLGRHLRELRRLIEARKEAGLTAEDLTLFRPAWTWEAVLAGANGTGVAFGVRVRSDLAAVRALRQFDSPEWYSLVRFGYIQSLKDHGAFTAFQDEVLARSPLSDTAWWIAEERQRHARPTPDSAYRDLRERLARFGDRPAARFGLRQFLFDDRTTDGELASGGPRLLALDRRFPDGFSVPPTALQVAERYARRKVRLADVPALVAEGLEAAELQAKYQRDSDLVPPGVRGSRGPDNHLMAERRAGLILIRHALATGEAGRARALLADFRRRLAATQPPDPTARSAGSWVNSHYEYLALAKEAGLDVQPLATGSPAPVLPESAERFLVADFEARDLVTGKVWRLADLRGKVTYVNVWTSWCGPCRGEMPGLEKLHQRWKDRADRAVLTISADTHPDLARAFLRELGRNVPAVHGIADRFFPPVYYPQNWLIDPQGRRVDYRPPAPSLDAAVLERIDGIAARLD